MNVNGSWYNELGSTMTIEQEGNVITGTYVTAVGEAPGTFPVIGLINPSPDASQTLAWTVTWADCPGSPTTAWCGQAQTVNGNPTITAMWLMTSETVPSGDWAATQIGQDVFTNQPASPAASALALARGASSHPRGPAT